jgi:hypothetical protein
LERCAPLLTELLKKETLMIQCQPISLVAKTLEPYSPITKLKFVVTSKKQESASSPLTAVTLMVKIS